MLVFEGKEVRIINLRSQDKDMFLSNAVMPKKVELILEDGTRRYIKQLDQLGYVEPETVGTWLYTQRKRDEANVLCTEHEYRLAGGLGKATPFRKWPDWCKGC